MTEEEIKTVPTPKLRFIVIDGRDGAGKDSIAHYICQHAAGGPWVMDHFGVEVQERCHGMYKLFSRKGGPCPFATFESTMDEPNKLFEGLSPRSAYRDFIAQVYRQFGRSAPGRWILQRIEAFMERQVKNMPEETRAKAVCIADASSRESIQVLMDKFGEENFTFLQVWRPGAPYGILQLVGNPIQIINDGTLEELGTRVRAALPELFPCEPNPVTESPSETPAS